MPVIGAVIYCRVSTKEQASNLSLPTQLKSCREYCVRSGFEVLAVFEDAGESAKNIYRPEFQRMLAYCGVHKKRVQHVVVNHVSRFSRNVNDHSLLKGLLLGLGITLRSASEPISDEPVGRFTENLLSAVAQFDNDVKAERTKDGMRAALERGRWIWRAPIGLRNGNTKAGESSLLVDEVRAPLVREAFVLMASGNYSVREVLSKVTALGLVSKKGLPLTPQAFGPLLRNEIYAGFVNAPGLGRTGIRGDFPALVPQVVFQRVQRVLGGPGSGSGHVADHPDFPLRRFVICGACDTPLTGSASKGRSLRYSYYHCRKCKGIRIKTAELEAQFVDLLETLQPRAEFMQLFRAIVMDVWKERGSEAKRLQVELEHRVEALRVREEQLDEAYLYRGAVDQQTYDRQRDKIRRDVALARIELADAAIEEIDIAGVLGFAEHLLTNAARLWLEASSDQKRRLQGVFFPEKLRFKNGGFGTAVTCMAFRQLREISHSAERMASPPGTNRGGNPV